MRRAVAVIVASVAIIAGTALAGPAPQQDCTPPFACLTFLPLVQVPLPGLDGLVIQAADMPSRFRVDAFHEVTNADAAAGYPDPVAALAAFEQQGRESSWYVRFLSDVSLTNATGVSDQVIRFATIEGADAGLDYASQHEFSTSPGYIGPFPLNLGQRSGYYVRTITNDGTEYDEFFFVIRNEHYVALIDVVGLSSALDTSEARAYAQRAFARLPAAP